MEIHRLSGTAAVWPNHAIEPMPDGNAEFFTLGPQSENSRAFHSTILF